MLLCTNPLYNQEHSNVNALFHTRPLATTAAKSQDFPPAGEWRTPEVRRQPGQDAPITFLQT
jgi:hypothetical protein